MTEKRMPRVYIVQKPYKDLDFSSASRYGALQFVFDSTDKPSLLPAPNFQKACKALKDFAENDYLLIIGGDPVGVVVTVAALIEHGFKKVNVLRYEREKDLQGNRTNNGYYVPIPVPLKF